MPDDGQRGEDLPLSRGQTEDFRLRGVLVRPVTRSAHDRGRSYASSAASNPAAKQRHARVAVREQRVERLGGAATEPIAQRIELVQQREPSLGRVELLGEPFDRVLVERHLALRAAADRADDDRPPQRLVQLLLGDRQRPTRAPRERHAALDLPEPLEEVEPLLLIVRGSRGPGTPS